LSCQPTANEDFKNIIEKLVATLNTCPKVEVRGYNRLRLRNMINFFS